MYRIHQFLLFLNVTTYKYERNVGPREGIGVHRFPLKYILLGNEVYALTAEFAFETKPAPASCPKGTISLNIQPGYNYRG
jgi:hypothetical protein